MVMMMDNNDEGYYDYIDEDTWVCYGCCEDCPHRFTCKDSLYRSHKGDHRRAVKQDNS